MTNEQYNANESNETLDDLDETLDDLADMPETKPWAVGSYAAKMTIKRNLGADKKKKGAYIAEFVHQETIELANPADETATTKEGDKSTIFISTVDKEGKKNEFAQGTLKMLMKPLAELYQTNSISEILEQNKSGVDVHVTFGVRKSKDPQYDDQQSVKAIQLA